MKLVIPFLAAFVFLASSFVWAEGPCGNTGVNVTAFKVSLPAERSDYYIEQIVDYDTTRWYGAEACLVITKNADGFEVSAKPSGCDVERVYNLLYQWVGKNYELGETKFEVTDSFHYGQRCN